MPIINQPFQGQLGEILKTELVSDYQSLRLFVKRNFLRDGKNQTEKPLWTVKSFFRGQGCKILFPVFGGEMVTAKIQTVKERA